MFNVNREKQLKEKIKKQRQTLLFLTKLISFVRVRYLRDKNDIYTTEKSGAHPSK